MFKSVFKEICIMLLLCVAIVLILGVLFYNYIPNNKAIPNKLATYETPEDIKAEMEKEIIESGKDSVTYQVTGAELSLYKERHSYTPGKVNPFSALSTGEGEENTENTNNQDINTEANTDINSETNTNVDPNSIGTFFNNTGLK